MNELGLTRYFFNFQDCTLVEDPEGSIFSDLEAARTFALVSARELWVDTIMKGRDLSGADFEINDGAGRCLAVVPLVAALPQGLLQRLSP